MSFNEITSYNNESNIYPNKRQRILPDSPLSNTIKTTITPTKNKSKMTKEEISAHRKEQRRIRNRISAATSRQKVKDRIDQLETKVYELQNKYNFVVDRLKMYEPSFTDDLDISVSLVSPCLSTISSLDNGVNYTSQQTHRVEESDLCNDPELEQFLKDALFDAI